MEILKSIIYFIIAGIFEIGGGYLIWEYFKNNKGPLYMLLGGLALILYGIIPTMQTASFGRVYAAYGGIFIILSILWGWLIDGTAPDRFDIIGSVVALTGVLIIMYWPR
ncbi:YnfA family protein [Pectinatus haikarae]|uniref:Small multidrug resistance family-3 protein n=1 Tax=Pectinatus haikarae TaxID=349096 RepID=A0ABT9YCY7_9FIRM|nr:YnfA family protein [Pectinatus haikarae]MDQ0205047.1 small multidrug resistance family-3 protein [Pectinatus haikarae]